MISRIGHLRSGISLQKLAYQTIPTSNLDTDTTSSSSHTDDIIYETDKILYNIQNTDEESSIQFHIQNDEDFYIHHDIIIPETLSDILPIELQKDFIVTCGFFDEIHLYDSFMFSPIEPEYKLIGHTTFVNSITLLNQNLISASDDKTTIEWDLEKLALKEKTTYNCEIKHVCNMNNRIISSGEYEIIDIYKNDALIERVKVKDENLVYFSDENGWLKCVDVRMNKILLGKKFHSQALTDFCFLGDDVLSVGFDGKIMRIDKEYESFVACKTLDQLSCIYMEEGAKFCVYAGVDDKINFLDID